MLNSWVKGVGTLFVRVKQKQHKAAGCQDNGLFICPVAVLLLHLLERRGNSDHQGTQHHTEREFVLSRLSRPHVCLQGNPTCPTEPAACGCISPTVLWRMRFMTAPFPSHSVGGISHLASSHTNESGHVSPDSSWQNEIWHLNTQHTFTWVYYAKARALKEWIRKKGADVQSHNNL